MANVDQETPNFSFSQLRKNSRIVAFLVCVLIASAIWVVNALSLHHETTVVFTVLPDKSVVGSQPSKVHSIRVDISGRGFDLFRFLYSNPHPVIDVAKAKSEFISTEGLRSFDLVTPFFKSYGKNFSIDQITPEWIPLNGNNVYIRKVAVKPVFNVSFKPQFMQAGPAVCVPDSVLLSSLAPIPDSLRSISVETIIRRDVSENVFTSAKINLTGIHDITVDSSHIWVLIPVERSTECVLKLPLTAENKSPNEVQLIPDVITLTCNVPLSMYNQTNASRFSLSAVIPQGSTTAVVTVRHHPSWATRILVNPSAVDFYYKAP